MVEKYSTSAAALTFFRSFSKKPADVASRGSICISGFSSTGPHLRTLLCRLAKSDLVEFGHGEFNLATTCKTPCNREISS